jgi:hypothetical protein
MAARPFVAVFHHIRQNEHEAVLKFLELYGFIAQLHRTLPDQPVDIQMGVQPALQDRR